MKFRKCRQCGEIKQETEFRQYYGETRSGKERGRYRTCKTCESINTRYKYLCKKQSNGKASESELQELAKIEQLYELLRAKGLKLPAKRERGTIMNIVDQMIEKHSASVIEVEAEDGEQVITAAPQELLDWLNADLSQYDPEYLQDVVADELIKKYRPQIGVDPNTYEPIYDDTHRDILNKLLERFDEYEDNYKGKDTDEGEDEDE